MASRLSVCRERERERKRKREAVAVLCVARYIDRLDVISAFIYHLWPFLFDIGIKSFKVSDAVCYSSCI
jgi:hypothetical protein